MTTAVRLRIASIVGLLFAAGHTLGSRKDWSPMATNPVMDAMRSSRFDVEGVSRSYLDFYRGFGFSLSVYLIMQAALLWQLATIAKTNPALVRPMVIVITIASVATTVITWNFILPVPATFGVGLTICLLAACFVVR
jgi:hypothetical protein